MVVGWITGGDTIHQPNKKLLPPTGFEPTPFGNSASKVARLQVHTTTPGCTGLILGLDQKSLCSQRKARENTCPN